MLNKFFKFLKGYVIIAIYGRDYERFINICVRRGIEIWGVTPKDVSASMCLYKRDFKRLKEIRRKTGTRIKILKKRGAYNILSRYKKRCVFAVCAVLFVVFLHTVSGRIWTVEINGIKNSDMDFFVSQLEENGVVIGAKKSGLKSIGEIKTDILLGNDDIAWMWIYFEGTKARVEVEEIRVPHKAVDESVPCDIVSTREGVISDVEVKNGQSSVRRGDAVEQGDILISGRVDAYREGTPERYMYVHALGTVKAYTMHEAVGTGKLYNEIRVPTGHKKRYVTLELFGKSYELYPKKDNGYKDYDIKTDCYELKLPLLKNIGVNITVENNIEVTVERFPLSEETAAQKVRDELEERIAKELMPMSELLSEDVDYELLDDETISVKCTMSFKERIGTEENLRSEQIDNTADRNTAGD